MTYYADSGLCYVPLKSVDFVFKLAELKLKSLSESESVVLQDFQMTAMNTKLF